MKSTGISLAGKLAILCKKNGSGISVGLLYNNKSNHAK